jgi:multidrug efflux pump subunit AcrA (membrane-fusion protein)
MREIKDILDKRGNSDNIKSFSSVYRVGYESKVKYWLLSILGGLVILLFLPWTQNIRARGSVTTLRQEQRPQELNTIISGRIIKWYVKEGDFVKQGDTIAQLAEIKDAYLDPQLLNRTAEQLNATKASVDFYKTKALQMHR